MTLIGIIIGSTRPGRQGTAVADWVHQHAASRDDATFEVVDLADFALPVLDEPAPAAAGQQYDNEHTRRWSAVIDSYDGYVIVTPEYNHSVPGALKNAIDFLYREWRDKAVGFVGYGSVGAARAVEQLRLIVAELHVADVRDQVALLSHHDVTEAGVEPGEHHDGILDRMLNEVVAWSDALAPLRTRG